MRSMHIKEAEMSIVRIYGMAIFPPGRPRKWIKFWLTKFAATSQKNDFG